MLQLRLVILARDATWGIVKLPMMGSALWIEERLIANQSTFILFIWSVTYASGLAFDTNLQAQLYAAFDSTNMQAGLLLLQIILHGLCVYGVVVVLYYSLYKKARDRHLNTALVIAATLIPLFAALDYFIDSTTKPHIFTALLGIVATYYLTISIIIAYASLFDNTAVLSRIKTTSTHTRKGLVVSALIATMVTYFCLLAGFTWAYALTLNSVLLSRQVERGE